MVEQVDTQDLKSCGPKAVRVRFPLLIPNYKSMFNIFKKKSEKEKLQETYAKLMNEAYKMSHTNRTESDKIMAQAEEIAKKIDLLK